MTYELVEGSPSIEGYLRLRAEAGLSPRSLEQARAALAGSWAARRIVHEGRCVAMGRVIGDGGWYFVVADMAVLPEHQRQGLGGRVLDALLAEIEQRAPGALVSLTADPPGVGLYRSRGFEEVPPPQRAMQRTAVRADLRALPHPGGTPS